MTHRTVFVFIKSAIAFVRLQENRFMSPDELESRREEDAYSKCASAADPYFGDSANEFILGRRPFETDFEGLLSPLKVLSPAKPVYRADALAALNQARTAESTFDDDDEIVRVRRALLEPQELPAEIEEYADAVASSRDALIDDRDTLHMAPPLVPVYTGAT